MRWFLLALLLVAMIGCAGDARGPAASSGGVNGPLYFESPRAAVPGATPLLTAKDWPTLARYYDISGSRVERSSLENGSFFYSERREGMQHPAGFSRYKHPFAPGFKFLRSEPAGEGTQKVVVQVEIDEGGGLVQRGLSAFLMRRNAGGWQFLPEHVNP